MKNTNKFIEKYPIIPVFYNANISLTKQIVKACYAGGIRVFEFTNRGEKALEVFKELSVFVKENCPEMLLGIGTIFEVSEARQFIDAGAMFVVQPIITPEVGKYCQENNVAWYPGAMTLNEIHQATKLGADIVKIFPGNVVGSGFIKSLKGPIPNVKVIVTGGVEPTKASLREWFSAGVTAVGIGSQLFLKEDLEKGNFTEMSLKIAELMTFVNNNNS